MLKNSLLAVRWFILILCIGHNTLAQTATVKGRVLSETRSPVDAVTILILNASDSALIKTSVSDKNGNYEALIPQGKLLIAAKLLGQTTFSGPYTADQAVVALPDVIVKTNLGNLMEVVVSSRRHFIEQKPGKTILNISKSSVASGNNAWDILQRAPGIQLDDNDNIVLRGRSGALVTIDGKAANLSSADIAELLRNMPGETIEAIELISNPSARYQAAGVAGVINIQLKKGKNAGTNGTFTSGLGYGDAYKASTGISLNHRSSTLNFFGNYNYGNQKRPEAVWLDRNVNFHNKVTRFEVSNNDEKARENQNFKAGADYFIGTTHTIGVLVNGNVNRQSSIEQNTTFISSNALPDSAILIFSDDQRTTRNSAYNLNYKGLLGKKGQTLTIDLDHLSYQRRSAELLQNDFLNNNQIPYGSTMRYQNHSPSDISVRSAKTDYIHPFSDKATLETGFRISGVTNENQRIFKTQIGNSWVSDENRSDEFNFSETIYAGYISFTGTIRKTTDFEAGLRAEHTGTKANSVTLGQRVNRKYLDLFPTFQLSHQTNANNKLHLSFSRRINRPYYEDLNPFIYFLDQYHFREGNPYLTPEYSSSIEAGHLYKEQFSTTLKYTHVKGIFLSFYEQNDATGVTVASQKNLTSQHSIGLVFSAPVTLAEWWTATCDLEGNYMRFTYQDGSNDLDHESPYLTVNAVNNFDLKKGISAELLFNYQSATYYGLLDWEPVYFFDIGFSKSLLQNRASLRVSLSDVFNTNTNKYSIHYQNLDLRSVEKAESRVARINFSYRFGKSTVKPARKRNTGSSEESRRIRS
ncbi:MAG TPA: outer membrane beta-barrel protein [Sphingobacteriaceae bacterium]